MTRAIVVADAAFIKLWESGMPSSQIAARYGCESSVVRNCASRAKLGKRVPTSIVDPDELRRLSEAGLTYVEIAARMGCDRSTISNAAKRIGLAPRTPRFNPEAMDRAEVVRLWFSACASVEIAEALAISPERLPELRGFFDLPQRYGFARKASEDLDDLRADFERECAARAAGDAAPEAGATVPKVSGAPFWTPARDAQVYRTDGRYVELRAVADDLGQPVRYVQARWHRLKVAA